MDFQIHCIETEAYGAVLRAFIAQSEVLSWGKEELITELRKELRVSDVEHREILGKISLDESIKSIREWRRGTCGQQSNARNPSVSDSMFAGNVSRKRLRPSQTPGACSPSPVHVRDSQWNSSAAVFSPPAHAGQAMMQVPQIRQAPISGKVRGSILVHSSQKGAAQSGSGNMKSGSDFIEIRPTDKLINEVERIIAVPNPDPSKVKRARLLLKEHERALMDAIEKLSDVADGDDSPDQRQKQHLYSYDEPDRRIQGFQGGFLEQFNS